MSLWLSPKEVKELTGRERWTAQCRALARLNIAFRLNAVGRPLVERAAVETYKERPGKASAEPNWSALSGKRAA